MTNIEASDSSCSAMILGPKGRTRSLAKRQQILDSASHLFMENGYDGVSMDSIAKTANVSKQTLYSHFGKKDELFRYCIESRCITSMMSPRLFDESLSTEVVLLELAEHFANLVMSEDGVKILRICVAGAEKYPEVSELFFQAGPETLIDLFSSYLKRKVGSKELKIDNCRYAACQFLFMIKSEQALRVLLGLPKTLNEAEMKEYRHNTVQLFLKGYAA